MDGARFGVVGAVNQALNPRMYQRAGAHRARLNCNKQLALAQTMVTDMSTSFSKRKNLGVSSGIGVGDVAVASAAHDALITNHNRANRNFAGLKRALGGTQGFFHPEFVMTVGMRFVLAHVQFAPSVYRRAVEAFQLGAQAT